MKVMILDGYNLLHRARFSFKKSENHVVFNFFRAVRLLTEKFDPDQVFCVIEGVPKQRLEIDPEYKANRTIEKDDPKYEELQEFHRQKRVCLEILREDFPFITVKHPDYEADDVIYNIIKHKLTAQDDITLVSTDTDFLQIYNEFDNVQIYNPVRKKMVDPPGYDYVSWKALRGDKTDNIFGIPGIGDKTALKIIENQDLFNRNMQDPEFKSLYERNCSLVKFHDMKNQMKEIQVWGPKWNWSSIKSKFVGYEFYSIVNPKSWDKFTNTFENLKRTEGD
jgi:DNA polymerase-1